MENLVFEFRTPEKEGKCLARVSATFEAPFGETTIHGFGVFQEDGKEPWISYPSTTYEKDGEQRRFTYIELPRFSRRRFEERLLQEYRAWTERNGVPF